MRITDVVLIVLGCFCVYAVFDTDGAMDALAGIATYVRGMLT